MSKEIVLSVDPNPKSPKYFVWKMDQSEAEQIKLAIAERDDQYPLLTTFSDYHEDFLCEGERLMVLCQETVDLEISLEATHHETVLLIKLLTMIGGLAVLSHDYKLGLYAYGE